MSRLYTLAPQEQPHWRFTADDFAARLRRRWPRSRMNPPIALRPDIRHDELLAELVPLHIPRPDPQAAGGVAAEILGRVLSSEEYPRLTHDVRLQRHRWATFTGLPLIAQLNLDRDAEPLLREALRTLALRAAVYRITGSDDTAATLAVPAPIDDMVRAVLAEHTLCTQLSRRLGIRFVRMLTAWDHFGWQPLDYTHRCYLHAGWELDERYWITADETARRVTILNRRYAEIGLSRGGQHKLRFELQLDPSMVGI